MLEILGTVFGAIFSGGATGIIGAIASRYADYKNKQLDMQLEAQRQANAIALKRVDIELMEKEWVGREKVAITEGETAMNVADAEAFGKSFEMEPKMFTTGELSSNQRWLFVVLDAIRGSIRPLLTVYLCVLTTMIYMQAKALLANDPLTALQALDLTKLVIGTILYLTTTCTLWWFGSRPRKQEA